MPSYSRTNKQIFLRTLSKPSKKTNTEKRCSKGVPYAEASLLGKPSARCMIPKVENFEDSNV